MKQQKQNPPKSYWESKILNWTADIYGERHDTRSPILRWARNPPEAVQFRVQVALNHLRPYIAGRRVVEFGCGTGRLSQKIIALGARSYQGFDLTDNGINAARLQNTHHNISFTRADISELDSVEADIVISTGLTTWISPEQIDHMFKISRGIDFYHTVSEPRISFRQFIRIFRELKTKKEQYRGKLKKASVIQAIAIKHGWEKVYIFRHPNLHSVACLSSLKID